MRHIQISTDVFAHIWSLREDKEETEDAILQRVLPGFRSQSRHESGEAPNGAETNISSDGLYDHRFNVLFPERFQIERTYLGQHYRASVQNGQWVLEGRSERYSTLNRLSQAIGTKIENAWVNWFYRNDGGERRPVSDLRDQSKIQSRNRW